VVRRNRRLVVVRHTVLAAGLRSVPEVEELHTGQEVVLHTGLAVVARHTGLEEAVHRIGLEEVVHRIGPVEVVHRIGLEEARHIDLAGAVHHTALEAALHIGLAVVARHTALAEEERRTVLVVEEHHTDPVEEHRTVLEAVGRSLAEEDTVGFALGVVVDSSLAEVVRILGVGELNVFSMCLP
jgi:hypothetical protein